MAVRRYYRDPPKNQPLVDAKARVTLTWSTHFDALARPSNATDVDVLTDPPNLAAGAWVRIAVPAQGARQGNFVAASFDQITADISIIGWVSADDVVTVKMQNESGGAVDLPAGTLRVRYWRHDP